MRSNVKHYLHVIKLNHVQEPSPCHRAGTECGSFAVVWSLGDIQDPKTVHSPPRPAGER